MNKKKKIPRERFDIFYDISHYIYIKSIHTYVYTILSMDQDIRIIETAFMKIYYNNIGVQRVKTYEPNELA